MIEYSGITNSLWVSKPIHLGSQLAAFSDKLLPGVKDLQTCHEEYEQSILCPIMGINPTLEQFQELVTYCAEDKLDVHGEPPSLNNRTLTCRNRLFDRSKINLEECNLETLKRVQQSAESEYSKFLKYYRSITFNQERSTEQDLTVKKDILITIRVHDIIFPTETSTTPTKPLCQEICVLGRQYLHELRDKIYCATDYTTACKDRDNQSEDDGLLKAKDVFKSGFIFIEDTFYNDLRYESNIDYSEVIVKWAKEKGIGTLAQESMTERKFEDLTVRFGFPYVYKHQGNCEHIIVFSDASLLHETDELFSLLYPLYKSIGRKNTQQCMMCCHFAARWITFENERVPVDPYYFCDKCFKSYNFIDGKKIGNFKYYEYHPYIPVGLPD